MGGFGVLDERLRLTVPGCLLQYRGVVTGQTVGQTGLDARFNHRAKDPLNPHIHIGKGYCAAA